ncbi:hypothetical protein ABZW11_38325 [Nonomuraea sp. NPDC004580]|uniref:hypothetical protein n=1 Tax=Nonomuraea sp. NPDC004580 TaxID=3154552 RepID=UPI0033A35AD0
MPADQGELMQRERKTGRASVIDVIAALLSAASLVVAIVALDLSRQALQVSQQALDLADKAWRKPYPPDPRNIPTFAEDSDKDGNADEYVTIHDLDSSLRLLQFLEEHEGMKIRILAYFDADYFGTHLPDSGDGLFVGEGPRGPGEDGFSLPSARCPKKPFTRITVTDCTIVRVTVKHSSKEARPFAERVGMWYMRGYFAVHGYQETWMGFDWYQITAMTDIEAVS